MGVGMDRDLEDRVVVLTGASSGTGRETALAFARAGTRPVVAARNRRAPAQGPSRSRSVVGGRCGRPSLRRKVAMSRVRDLRVRPDLLYVANGWSTVVTDVHGRITGADPQGFFARNTRVLARERITVDGRGADRRSAPRMSARTPNCPMPTSATARNCRPKPST